MEVNNAEAFFKRLASEGGMTMRMNSKSMASTMGKDLYKYATSSIRELLANAVTATKKAQASGIISRPHIEVEIDAVERLLVISDNGIGISYAAFEKLRDMGTSGNCDPRMSGKYGFGYYSHSLATSALFIDTMSHEGGQKVSYQMVCSDGSSFSYIGGGTRETDGTTLKMVLYDTINIHHMARYIEHVARRCGVDVTLTTKNINGYDDVPIEISYSGPHERHNYKPVMHIDNDDYEFAGYIDGSADSSELDGRHENDVTLIGMPIKMDIGDMKCEDELKDIPFDFYALNIKDERKYEPMPDRESLKEESAIAITKSLLSEIDKKSKEIEIPTTLEEFIVSKRRHEVEWLQKRFGAKKGDVPWYAPIFNSDEEDHQYTSLGSEIDTNGRKIAFSTEKLFNHTEVQINTGYTLIRPARRRSQKAIEVAKMLGIKDARELAKEFGLRLSREQNRDVVIHKIARGKSYTDNSTYEEVVMATTVPLSSLLEYARKFNAKHGFMKNNGGLESAIPYEVFIDKIGKKVLETNQGKKTVADIVSAGNVTYVRVAGYGSPAFASQTELNKEYSESIAKIPKLLITGSFDLFELAVFMNPELSPITQLSGNFPAYLNISGEGLDPSQ